MAARLIKANGIDLWTEAFGDRNHPPVFNVTSPSDRRPLLQKLAIPALVIHGTDAPILPYAHGLALANTIPGARLLSMDGVGHNMPAPLLPDVIGAIVALTAEGKSQ